MPSLEHLFQNNAEWTRTVRRARPGFFEELSKQQAPEYFWIGCCDSRVPANEIVGLLPGELFVHRNVANVVNHSDLNCLSALQYAVEILGVRHVIVCGHYGCGGVRSAMSNVQLGIIDNWLQSVREIYGHNQKELNRIPVEEERADRLCELNVIQQVTNVAHTSIVQNAWNRGHELVIHGWIYRLNNGLLRDLRVSITNTDPIPPIYRFLKKKS